MYGTLLLPIISLVSVDDGVFKFAESRNTEKVTWPAVQQDVLLLLRPAPPTPVCAKRNSGRVMPSDFNKNLRGEESQSHFQFSIG